MKISSIYGMGYDSNIYIIPGKNPSIIDCGTGFFINDVYEEIKKYIDPKQIGQIILTHEHFDHCGGVKKIFEKTGKNAKIFAHENASEKIEKGESEFAKMLGGEMPKIPVDIKLKNNDKLLIGDEEFNVIHTPGHTPGCICLYNKKTKSLISGDTVFSYGSFGRYDFPGGDVNQLKESIHKLTKLEVENLYPGHESIVEGKAAEHIALSYKNISYII